MMGEYRREKGVDMPIADFFCSCLKTVLGVSMVQETTCYAGGK